MNLNDWLAKAREDAVVLRSLVGNYHPSAGAPGRHKLEITAPGAEVACASVRQRLARQQPQDPLQRLNRALLAGDVDEVMSVLQGAWFGVPESTSCWQVTGFREAVDLLDDPPEPPEEGEQREPTTT